MIYPLYESNIILFVGSPENLNFPNNQVIFWDENKKKKIGVIILKEPVLGLRFSKEGIFVLVSNKVGE